MGGRRIKLFKIDQGEQLARNNRGPKKVEGDY